jgi:hypothetical protein
MSQRSQRARSRSTARHGAVGGEACGCLAQHHGRDSSRHRAHRSLTRPRPKSAAPRRTASAPPTFSPAASSTPAHGNVTSSLPPPPPPHHRAHLGQAVAVAHHLGVYVQRRQPAAVGQWDQRGSRVAPSHRHRHFPQLRQRGQRVRRRQPQADTDDGGVACQRDQEGGAGGLVVSSVRHVCQSVTAPQGTADGGCDSALLRQVVHGRQRRCDMREARRGGQHRQQGVQIGSTVTGTLCAHPVARCGRGGGGKCKQSEARRVSDAPWSKAVA